MNISRATVRLAAAVLFAGCNQRTSAPGTSAIAPNLSQRPTAYNTLPLDMLAAATNVGTNLFDAIKYRVTGGLGMALLGDKETGFLRVMTVASNSPAELAGLRPGDYITHVDHRPVKNVAVTQAVNWMRGINGTTVKLTVQPSLPATSQLVTMRRISSMDSRQMLSR